MTSHIHIYTANKQPATNYSYQLGEDIFHSGFDPDDLIYTECCRHKRLAKDCTVQCYYDGLYVWCAEGHGCKDPVVIKAKKDKEFKNRSLGQKLRWAKRGKK